MSTTAHTPTPWRVEENTDLIWGACNADDASSYGMGYPIVSGFASFGNWAAGRPDFNEKFANAEFIVTAVNSHDALTARIAEQEKRIDALTKALKPFAQVADMEHRATPAESVFVNVARCRDARAILSEGEGA